jgi:hypothetical protein
MWHPHHPQEVHVRNRPFPSRRQAPDTPNTGAHRWIHARGEPQDLFGGPTADWMVRDPVLTRRRPRKDILRAPTQAEDDLQII